MSALARHIRGLRREDGLTLTEMLITMTVMIIMLAAVLTVFEAFGKNAKESRDRSEAQDLTRMHTDRLARELRNLASPAQNGQPIEVAEGNDLVFKSVDRLGPNAGLNASNVRRVRYCLPNNGKWHKQWQTWSTASPPNLMPDRTKCPGTGWTGTSALQKLKNNEGAPPQPLFRYDAVDPTSITSIRTDLLISAGSSKALRLRTAVALRNQNRGPTAAFSVTSTGGRQVVLNGSASSDPDGQKLEYLWYFKPQGTTTWPLEPAARGPIVQWTVPGTAVSGDFKLKVVDSGDLFSEAAPRTVTIS